jgi:hypothetical protein
MVMTDEENNKKYAETAAALCSIAFFFCFRGPQIFTDLYYFAGWAVICFIFACVVYYKKEKSKEDVAKQPVSHLTSQKECPYCHAVVDGSSTFCGSCGKRIQKICPHCGAAVNNDDMFCKNCGHTFCDDSALSTNTQEIQIRKCNHCGAELNNSDTFCQKCGAKIDDNSTAVSSAESQHIIDFNKDSSNDSNRGDLFIRWEGKWSIIDYKVQIWVNGIKQGDYSFKDGFEVIVPISSPEMVVETKLSFHKTKEVLTLNPQENYSYNLAYNTVSGSFGFILCDNDGNELETDKLHWGYFLLCFLIPIVGFIYALSIKKKKPATSNQALMVSLLGFVVSLILSYSMPVAISRYNEIKAAKIAREKFVKDSLEQVRQDSIRLAEKKEQERKDSLEKARLQYLQKPYLALLDKYNVEDDNWGKLYFLFDITGDDLPEIWMNIKEGEDYKFCVYSCQNGESKLLFKEELGYNNSFYCGDNYVLMEYAHMGYQVINKFYLSNNVIKKEKIFETEEAESMDDVVYKEIEEPSISTYELTDKNPIYEIK